MFTISVIVFGCILIAHNRGMMSTTDKTTAQTLLLVVTVLAGYLESQFRRRRDRNGGND